MHKETVVRYLAIPAFVMAMGLSSGLRAETSGQYIDDATITTKVKAALAADSQVKAMNVSVQTDHGTVQLTGNVDSKTQENAAVKDANRVDGVQSVKDLLTVRGSQEE